MHQTSLGFAILRLFGDLGQRLAERSVPANAIQAYLFGGCAVHMHVASRVSSDLDVEFDYHKIHKGDLVLVLNKLAPVDYYDPEQGPSQLVYDQNFNNTLGPLHEGYRERAVRVEFNSQSPVTVWLPSPEDLAISKLGRLSATDTQDILTLLRRGCASWERFDALAREAALYYVGRDLTANIDYIGMKWLRDADTS